MTTTIWNAEGTREKTGHWVQTELCPKRVRVEFGGETVADSKRALLMLESNHTPVYYFPPEDVRTDLLMRTSEDTH